jgi:DNA-binding NtrC family response regulator
MSTGGKGILIIDEEGFSRVCSAILEKEGYSTETVTGIHELTSRMNYDDFGLIIASYPYGALLFEAIQKRKIPTLILSDHIGKDLITTLEGFDNSYSYCMIKPLDYTKFKTLVKQLMSSDSNMSGEYNIV